MATKNQFQVTDFEVLNNTARARDILIYDACIHNADLFRALRKMLDQVGREELLVSWLAYFKEYFPKYYAVLLESLPENGFQERLGHVKAFVEAKAAKNTKLRNLVRELMLDI